LGEARRRIAHHRAWSAALQRLNLEAAIGMATIGDLCCIRCLVLGDLTQVSLLPMTAFAGHAGNAGELA